MDFWKLAGLLEKEGLSLHFTTLFGTVFETKTIVRPVKPRPL
jgi:hypothetical protein